jgi:hypothetical protein
MEKKKNSIVPVIIMVVFSICAAGAGAWSLSYWWNTARHPEIVKLDVAPLPPGPMRISAGTAAGTAGPPVRTIAPAGIAPSGAPQPADTTGIGARLIDADPKVREQGIQSLRTLAQFDERSMAVGLPKLIPPLMAGKYYSDVEELAHAAIMQRPYDMNVVPIVEQARASAFFAEDKYPQALMEAKMNFNVSTLAGNNIADQLFTKALAKASAASGPIDRKSVKVDAPDYETTAAGLEASLGPQRRGSYNVLMEVGNLLLLADHPDEAKTYFYEAGKASAGNARNIRLAVEGVGRCLRASAQDVQAARTYIMALDADPSTDGASYQLNGEPSLDVIRAAANQVSAQARYR